MSETELLQEAPSTTPAKKLHAPPRTTLPSAYQDDERKTHPQAHQGLRRFVTSPLVILGILSSIGMAWGLSTALQHKLEATASNTLLNTSQLIAQQIAKGLQDRSAVTIQLSKAAAAQMESSSSPPDLLALNEYAKLQPSLMGSEIADAQGKVIHSTINASDAASADQAAWFVNGAQRPAISDVYSTPSSNTAGATGAPMARMMDFSAPIQAASGFKGVLVTHYQTDWVQSALQTAGLTTSNATRSEIFVFDRAGALLFTPADKWQQWLGLGQTLPIHLNTLPANRPILLTQNTLWKDSNAEYLTTVASLPANNASNDLGWLVVARQPLSAIHAPAWTWFACALGGGLVLTFIAAWLVSRRSGTAAAEINQLANAATQDGRVDVKDEASPAFAITELAQLSQAWQSARARMQQVHDSMLQEIQARTQELNEANRELDRQASTDLLTGLLNRRGFDAQIQFAMSLARRSGRPLCFMTLDIDHFRQVNEQYGTEVGDLVLKSVATQLRTRLRDSDIISRFGGEEFMVLLPDTPPEAAQRIGRELLYNIEHHRWPLVGTLTLSAGITALRPTLQNGTEDNETGLLQRSEEAMLKSKQAGRNQVHFVP